MKDYPLPLNRVRGLSLLLVLGLGLGTSCASSSDHTLVVQLRTDLVGMQEFSHLEVTLLPLEGRGDARRLFVETERLDYGSPHPIAEFASVQKDAYRLGVSLRSRDGVVLVEHPLLVTLTGNAAVTVRISRSCLNVACAENEACYGGQCVDYACDVESGSGCGFMPACGSDVDCAPAASCATGSCELGTCYATARTSATSAGDACDPAIAWCDPDQGCRPLMSEGADPDTLPGGCESSGS